MELTFTAKLEAWKGDSWCFVRLPKGSYEDLKSLPGPKRGFGSVKVEYAIGESSWRTSVFPDSDDKSFILFIKKSVRQAEKLEIGDNVTLTLNIFI